MLKKFFLFAGLLMASCVLNAQNNPLILKFFVSDSANPKIRLTTQGDYAYTYVKANNSAVTGSGAGTTGLTEITVPSIGTYNVSITPTGTFRFSSMYASDPDKDKISEITQWGNVTWNPDLSYMFAGYTNLQITATDIPDFSNVTNMSYMFQGCTNLSVANNINSWNVSNVTNMSWMFNNAAAFNKNIGNWNTANVTDMSFMFRDATQFNQNINNWNVSQVTNMNNMFMYAGSFNQDLNGWNVGNVIDFSSMFYAAASFNKTLSAWNTSAGTNFNQMFVSAQIFNQNISTWDVSNALNMSNMFGYAYAFNQNLGNWQLSPVVTIANIFNYTGMDCNNFGATLKGWAENPNCPLGRLIGVQNINYGPGGQIYMNQLISNKGWTFTGNPTYSPTCTESFLSVEDVKTGKTKLTLYPNPASETVFIKSAQRAKTVHLIDASGKMVLNASATSQISVQHLPAGIYFVKVTLADGSQSTHKLIKK